MKKAKTRSNIHIAFIIIMFAALISFIVSLCMFDYDFNRPFAEIWQDNVPSIILAGAFVALNLIIIISAIVLRIKNDALTRKEVTLAFQITAVLVLEIVLCVPIFILWIIQKIHDAVSSRKYKDIN